MEALRDALVSLEWVILVYFLAVNAFYLVLLASAGGEMRRVLRAGWRENRWRVLRSDVAPTISVLAPAFDEGPTIAESVRALLALQYPSLEVVVVNDGSSDDTLDVLRREFALTPVHPIVRRRVDAKSVRALYRSPMADALVVVDKENGGKADALNAGLNVATGDLVCAIDADTIIESDALLRIIRPFLLHSDVVAAGGTVRVANGSVIRGARVVEARVPGRPLPGMQAVEYLRAFLFGRLGWNRLGGNLIISGAFGLFRRETMIDVGGYVHGSVGEDMELVAAIRRQAIERGEPSRVEFIPDPVAWTEVPESFRGLGRQRDRWQRGLADVLWRYRRVAFNPRYGAFGMVVMPYFVLIELLAPAIEAIGLLGLGVGLAVGAVDASFAILFLLVAYGLGIILNAFTLLLEELGYRRYERIRDRLLLLLWAVLENLGYRQLTVLWRLRGLFRFLARRGDWGAMTRRGFGTPPEAPRLSLRS